MNSVPEVSDGAKWEKIASRNDLDDASLAKLAGLGTVRAFKAGTILFNEGEQHRQLYFVCSGAFRLDMVTPTCGTQTILSVGVGDLLAWSALLGDSMMTATAIAIDDSEVVAFDTEELKRALDADTALGYDVMKAIARALSRRLVATRLQLLDLYHR